MPKSRHSHRTAGLVALIALIVLAGCYQQREPPRQFVPGNDLHDQFTSQGNRIVIDTDDEAIPTIKLRERARFTRVYDDKLRPAGRIYPGDRIQTRSVDGQTRHDVELDDDTGIATLEHAWDLQQTDYGWRLYNPDGDRIAAFVDHGDDRWVLTDAENTPTFRVTADDDTFTVADADGTPLFEVPTRRMSAPKALALTIGDLPPLERVAAGMFIGGE